jgi:hypothetical protein
VSAKARVKTSRACSAVKSNAAIQNLLAAFQVNAVSYPLRSAVPQKPHSLFSVAKISVFFMGVLLFLHLHERFISQDYQLNKTSENRE